MVEFYKFRSSIKVSNRKWVFTISHKWVAPNETIRQQV